jgi:SAM-dependent methyltransferase
MISFETAMLAMQDDRIKSLETGTFKEQDVLNLILQRSEIIRDQENFNRYIKRWTKGDPEPLLELVRRLGHAELVRRASAFILLEYLELKPVIELTLPKKIADIGCGYAIFDLFLAKDFGSELILIDLEENDHKHFGFESEGAAYSNLRVAHDFLTSNGLQTSQLDTRNPSSDDLNDIDGLDLVCSFISCGYHYPWQTYQDFFERSLRHEGVVILDLRKRIADRAKEEMTPCWEVETIGQAAQGSASRVMLKRRKD